MGSEFLIRFLKLSKIQSHNLYLTPSLKKRHSRMVDDPIVNTSRPNSVANLLDYLFGRKRTRGGGSLHQSKSTRPKALGRFRFDKFCPLLFPLSINSIDHPRIWPPLAPLTSRQMAEPDSIHFTHSSGKIFFF